MDTCLSLKPSLRLRGHNEVHECTRAASRSSQRYEQDSENCRGIMAFNSERNILVDFYKQDADYLPE